MKKLIIILLLFSLALTFSLPAIASEISTAVQSCIVNVTNNSTAENNVATVFTGNTTAWVSNGMMNSSGNNTAIRTSSGADVAYMPGYGPSGNPWALWVPSIATNTIATDILYTGGTANMNGEIRYFPGPTGMTTPDDASLEITDNFTVELEGLFNTTYSTNQTYIDKPEDFRIYCGATENITAAIVSPFEDLTTYTEADLNNKLTVTIPTAAAVDCDRDEDVLLWSDKGVNHFDALNIDFEIQIYSTSQANALSGGIAISNTPNVDVTGAAASDINFGADQAGSLHLFRGPLTASDYSVGTAVDNAYYCTMIRAAGNDSVSVEIYSNSTRTVLVDTVTVAGFGAAKYRYVYAFQNYNDGGGGKDFDGYVQNIRLGDDTEVSAGGLPTGEYNVAATANGTHFWIDINGSTIETIALAGASVGDSGNDWVTSYNATMPYMLHLKITKGGNFNQHIEWQYDTTFTDLTGNGNDATPSFRTASSDPHVSASLASCSPIEEAQAPPYVLQEAPDFFSTIPGATSEFTVNVTPTYPGRDVIRAIAIKGIVPETLVTVIFATWVLLMFSLCLSYMMKRQGVNSLFVKAVFVVAIMCVYVAVGIYDVWQILYFAHIALALCWLSRQREAY